MKKLHNITWYSTSTSFRKIWIILFCFYFYFYFYFILFLFIYFKNIQFAHSSYDSRRVKLISDYAFSYESGTAIPHFVEKTSIMTRLKYEVTRYSGFQGCEYLGD